MGYIWPRSLGYRILFLFLVLNAAIFTFQIFTLSTMSLEYMTGENKKTGILDYLKQRPEYIQLLTKNFKRKPIATCLLDDCYTLDVLEDMAYLYHGDRLLETEYIPKYGSHNSQNAALVFAFSYLHQNLPQDAKLFIVEDDMNYCDIFKLSDFHIDEALQHCFSISYGLGFSGLVLVVSRIEPYIKLLNESAQEVSDTNPESLQCDQILGRNFASCIFVFNYFNHTYSRKSTFKMIGHGGYMPCGHRKERQENIFCDCHDADLNNRESPCNSLYFIERWDRVPMNFIKEETNLELCSEQQTKVTQVG
mmetsp:Transcript_11006/g.12093  ORF Transcript_11006/g.12093 Transcript_11006/m.12093 type:complete len:307 (+) Transcript_11006:105-1025(+)